jgi:hypothetical protein
MSVYCTANDLSLALLRMAMFARPCGVVEPPKTEKMKENKSLKK